MIIKGRSPNLRHVGRTHRVDLDWLFERIMKDPGIFVKYVGTKEQLADILTKGSFTADAWKTLMNLCLIQRPEEREYVNTLKPLKYSHFVVSQPLFTQSSYSFAFTVPSVAFALCSGKLLADIENHDEFTCINCNAKQVGKLSEDKT